MNSKLIKQFNEEHATLDQIANLRIRTAVRVILLDNANHVAIIHSKKLHYCSLPGGGVEQGANENLNDAVIRETKEETGCDSEIVKSLGIIEEVRLQDNLINRSHGFMAKVIGKKGTPVLNHDERDEDFNLLWLDFPTARNKIGTYPANVKLYHKYFLERDLTFLNIASVQNLEAFNTGL